MLLREGSVVIREPRCAGGGLHVQLALLEHHRQRIQIFKDFALLLRALAIFQLVIAFEERRIVELVLEVAQQLLTLVGQHRLAVRFRVAGEVRKVLLQLRRPSRGRAVLVCQRRAQGAVQAVVKLDLGQEIRLNAGLCQLAPHAAPHRTVVGGGIDRGYQRKAQQHNAHYMKDAGNSLDGFHASAPPSVDCVICLRFMRSIRSRTIAGGSTLGALGCSSHVAALCVGLTWNMGGCSS